VVALDSNEPPSRSQAVHSGHQSAALATLTLPFCLPVTMGQTDAVTSLEQEGCCQFHQ
jgi:hypothetical protein